MKTEETMLIMDQVLEAFNKHDLDGVMSHFAEDGVMILAAGPEIWGKKLIGKEAIREALAARFKSSPDLAWNDCDTIAAGNRASTKWHVTGTLPDNGKIDIWGCDHWEFQNGKITVKDTYYKSVTK